MADDFGPALPSAVKKQQQGAPGTGVPILPGAPAAAAPSAPAAPVAAAPAAPTPAPAAPAAGSPPPKQSWGDWLWGDPNATIAKPDTMAPGIQPGQSPQDFLLAHLAQLGQGAQQIGHGVYNYGRSAGNFATAGGLDPTLAWIGRNEPPGTPSFLQLDPDATHQRAATEQARTEMGPGMTALSGLTGLRGFSRGVGPVGAGPVAETVAGKSFLNPALQVGAYKGAESAFSGDDPMTIAKNTAEGLGIGGGVGLLANKVLSPVMQWAATKYYGGSTPESISEKLGQGASDAEKQAAQQAADAQAQAAAKTTAAQQQAAAQTKAADETLNKLQLNRKDLGFQFGANKDPTYGDLQAQLENFKNIEPEQDPGGVVPVLQQRITKAFQGPEVAEAQTAAAAARDRATAAATAAQQQTEAEAAATTAQGQSVAGAARAKANAADWLGAAGRTVGLPGVNVPAEAAQKLTQPGLSPAEQEAYRTIAQSGQEGGQAPELWRSIARMVGGGAGSWAGHASGLPFMPEAGMMMGQEVGSNLVNKLAGPSGAAAAQQAIARAYPALTGEWPAAARGQLAAGDLIKTLYGLK